MAAQAIIPSNNPYAIPTGLAKTTTPQGGTAYTDTNGTYGQAGSIYLPGANGFTLAPALPNSPNTNNSGSPSGSISVQPNLVTPTTPTATGTPAVGTGTAGTPQPSSSGSGTATGATETATPQLTAAQIQAQADALESAPVASGSSSVRTSAQIESDFEDSIAAMGSQPTPPDANAEQTAAGNEYGLPALQSQLAQLQSQAISDEGSLSGSGMGGVASLVNGRIKVIGAQYAAQIKDVQSQITNANTAITALMKNNQSSYEDAEAQWNDEYKVALGVYTAAENNLTKTQTQALAAQKVIVSSYAGNPTGAVGSITPDEISTWNNLDLQTGFLPVGTTLAAVMNKLNITKFVKGSDGNAYVEGFDSGVPYTALVGDVGGTTAEANGTAPNDLNANGITVAQQKVYDAFAKSLADNSKLTAASGAITREQFIRELQSEYPTMSPSYIQNEVYTTYPDGFNQ